MNCPKYVAAAITYQGYVGDKDVACDGEECGWWSKFTQECAIPMLALELNHLREYVSRMESKMPHELQFRTKP